MHLSQSEAVSCHGTLSDYVGFLDPKKERGGERKKERKTWRNPKNIWIYISWKATQSVLFFFSIQSPQRSCGWPQLQGYAVASISRLREIINLFCKISSLLWGSCAKKTYNLKEPTNRSHPIFLNSAFLLSCERTKVLGLIHKRGSLLRITVLILVMWATPPLTLLRLCKRIRVVRIRVVVTGWSTRVVLIGWPTTYRVAHNFVWTHTSSSYRVAHTSSNYGVAHNLQGGPQLCMNAYE